MATSVISATGWTTVVGRGFMISGQSKSSIAASDTSRGMESSRSTMPRMTPTVIRMLRVKIADGRLRPRHHPMHAFEGASPR